MELVSERQHLHGGFHRGRQVSAAKTKEQVVCPVLPLPANIGSPIPRGCIQIAAAASDKLQAPCQVRHSVSHARVGALRPTTQRFHRGHTQRLCLRQRLRCPRQLVARLVRAPQPTRTASAPTRRPFFSPSPQVPLKALFDLFRTGRRSPPLQPAPAQATHRHPPKLWRRALPTTLQADSLAYPPRETPSSLRHHHLRVRLPTTTLQGRPLSATEPRRSICRMLRNSCHISM